jgi:hypothetical protein
VSPDEERKHVLDLGRLTGSTPDTISKVLDAQIALLMLDIGLRGRAQTVVGEVNSPNLAATMYSAPPRRCYASRPAAWRT